MVGDVSRRATGRSGGRGHGERDITKNIPTSISTGIVFVQQDDTTALCSSKRFNQTGKQKQRAISLRNIEINRPRFQGTFVFNS